MAVEYVDDVAFQHKLSSADLAHAKKLIVQSRAATHKKTGELRKFIQSGDDTAQLNVRDWLMTSPEALLASAIATNMKLRSAKRFSLERCLEAPTQIDFTHPLEELVRVRIKLKSSGGFRALHNHGLLHRTAQHAVQRVIGPSFKPRSFQYTNRGLHAAVAAAKAAITSGHVHIARLDIKDFFPSFSADALITNLPLPKEVVEHVVLGRHMAVVIDKEKRHGHAPLSLPVTDTTLLILARLGIPLGSGCSPIVSMFCMSLLVWEIIPGVVLLNYADDFLLLALSAGLLDEAIGKLVVAVGNVPGGHFHLQTKAVGHACKGFEFLGHHLSLAGGTLHTSPTQANLEELFRKLSAIEEKVCTIHGWTPKGKATAIKCIATMQSVLDGWSCAFKECDKLEALLAAYAHGIVQTSKYFDVSKAEVSAAVESWMGYEPSDYALGH